MLAKLIPVADTMGNLEIYVYNLKVMSFCSQKSWLHQELRFLIDFVTGDSFIDYNIC